jgi:hypothetical protein
MRIELDRDAATLVFESHRISLNRDDLRYLALMTPLGRKVHLREKAKRALRIDPADPEARAILDLSKLPSRNWSFPVPSLPIRHDVALPPDRAET